jgi:hypothetical protein
MESVLPSEHAVFEFLNCVFAISARKMNEFVKKHTLKTQTGKKCKDNDRWFKTVESCIAMVP